MSDKIEKEYELRYFNLTAICEPIRWILAYSGASWKDTRIDYASWPSVKQDYKWGHVPELIIKGGQTLTQSRSIGRYLAKTCNLIPKDNLDAARCDEIVDAILDLTPEFKSYVIVKYFSQPGDLVELKAEILTGKLPNFLKNFNDFITENHQNESYGKGAFIFGKDITWADFWLSHFTRYWIKVLDEPDLLKDYEALIAQQKAVLGIPQINKFMKDQPPTLF